MRLIELSLFTWLIKPILWFVTFYALFSALVVILLKQIKRTSLKSSLITLYFCTTIFACLLVCAIPWAMWSGVRAENLRQSSVDTAESVRILTLLRKCNAEQVDSNHYYWVTHNLENKIDALLPVANDYLSNRGSLCWKLQDWWLFGDMTEVCFERDLPLVVRYRELHPPVWNHGPYHLVMERYKNPKPLWRDRMWPLESDSTEKSPTR